MLLDNFGPGLTGDIVVDTNNLHLTEGGLILHRSFGSGIPGNIFIDSSESILVEGQSAVSPGVVSAIASTNLGPTLPENEDLSVWCQL